MTDIEVRTATDDVLRVIVTGGGSSTEHDVTITADDLRRLAPESSRQELAEAAFRFLLDRESKESILGRFGVSDISGYFPEFPDEVGGYL